MRNAIRITITTFGSLVGLIGIEHGTGEILQGNTVPAGFVFPSWPDAPFFRILGGEPAASIVPNLLVTGILAILLSSIYIGWAALFVHRRHGGQVLILISLSMFLFGAGIFPPVLGVLIGAAATRINAPQNGWWAHLSSGSRRFLEAIWPWSFGGFLLSSLLMLPGIPILSYFFGVNDANLIFFLLFCMFGFLIMASIAGFVRDCQRQVRSSD